MIDFSSIAWALVAVVGVIGIIAGIRELRKPQNTGKLSKEQTDQVFEIVKFCLERRKPLESVTSITPEIKLASPTPEVKPETNPSTSSMPIPIAPVAPVPSLECVFINWLWERFHWKKHEIRGYLESFEFYLCMANGDPMTVGSLATTETFHNLKEREIGDILDNTGFLPRKSMNLAGKVLRPIRFKSAILEEQLVKYVKDYTPFSLYDKLELNRPEPKITNEPEKAAV